MYFLSGGHSTVNTMKTYRPRVCLVVRIGHQIACDPNTEDQTARGMEMNESGISPKRQEHYLLHTIACRILTW